MDEIRTARLLLRPARMDDLAAMHAILSDAAAMRWWSTPPHAEIGQTRAWLSGMVSPPHADSEDYVIEHQGRVVGKAGAYRLPEVGFILHPAAWGQGLAREAMAAIIPRLFDRWPVPALEADVDPRNAASLGLLGRLGFEKVRFAERTWLVGEEWCDSVYLALPREAAPDVSRL